MKKSLYCGFSLALISELVYDIYMSREIKFRAWDKVGKKMISWKDIFNNLGYLYDFFNGVFGNLILLQYTGLKDKNRVDIYEGDILTDGKDNTSAVEWRNSLASYMLDFNYGNTELYLVLLNDVKIIGNIYENPELLSN